MKDEMIFSTHPSSFIPTLLPTLFLSYNTPIMNKTNRLLLNRYQIIFCTVSLALVLLPGSFAQDRNVPTEQLIQQLQDKDKRARLAAINELTKLGEKANSAIPALTPLLKDQDALIRSTAAFAIGKIGGDLTSVIPILIELLSDQNEGVRRDAAGTLVQIGAGAKAAVPQLTNLLND